MASTPVGSNALIQEVLDRSNYKKWRLRLKTYFLSEDLWDIVEANTEPPKLEDDQAGYKAWTKKNAKALYAIQSSCGPEMFTFISETESAEAAWEALEQECKVLLGYDENNADHLVRYKSFIGYVRRGDWDRAKKCLGEVDVRSVIVRAIARWDGMTALHVAAWEGHAHIVKELVHLMTQEDCKTKTGSGRTALHLAAQQGHVHVVKELPVQLMGEVQDKGGDTALHDAVHSGKVDVVKELVLLMRQEDLQIKNHAGYTALHLAVNKGNMPMVKEFVTKEKGENNIVMDDFERYIPFTTYVKNGDWDKANECLRELDDPCGAVTAVDPRDNYRDTALHVAAREGHLDVIRGLILLLKMRREDLELKTAQDFTAYGSGITLGVTEEFLMERAKYMVEQYEKTHGIFLEMQNSEGCTALYLAVRVGNVDIVKELAHMMTQEGLELKSFSGSSALHQAIGYERIDIVQVLVPLMRKEGLEIKDDHGDTPLNYAVLKGNVDIVKALVQSMRQEGLEIRNSKAEIALPRAISKGHMHIVRELLPLMRPEAFEEKDGRGCTALCGAIACLKDGEVYEIAKYMAERNDRVFGIPSAPYDEIPVVQALRWRKWRLARSIYSLTPLELIDQPNGGAFICYCLDTSTQIGKTVNFSNHFN
ncbi:PREDICTED: alpha-latrotoxin-Lh1a-like [Fragaria vesca subsp. vesca]